MMPNNDREWERRLGLPPGDPNAAHDAPTGADDAAHSEARRQHAELMRVYETFDRDHENQRDKLLALIPDGAPSLATAARKPRVGGFVMNFIRRHTAVAVLTPAACLMFAIVAFLSTGTQSAFAKAIERLRELHSARCQVTMKIVGGAIDPGPMSGTFVMTQDHGSRMDYYAGGTLTTSSYFTTDGEIVSVVPLTKTMIRLKQSDDAPLSAKAGMLDAWLGMLRKIDGDADRELGAESIDGRQCQGFELSGARLGFPAGNASFKLWVESGSSLPVRMEMSTAGPNPDETIIATYDRFEWNPTIDLATLQVPDAGELNLIEMSMPHIDETTLLAALKVYSELTGEYPADLNPTTLPAKFIAAYMKSAPPADPADPAVQKELMNKAILIGGAAGFYQGLTIQKLEPEYFGESVKPGDASAVLVRWNAKEGGKRVIYGDLRIETVDTK